MIRIRIPRFFRYSRASVLRHAAGVAAAAPLIAGAPSLSALPLLRDTSAMMSLFGAVYGVAAVIAVYASWRRRYAAAAAPQMPLPPASGVIARHTRVVSLILTRLPFERRPHANIVSTVARTDCHASCHNGTTDMSAIPQQRRRGNAYVKRSPANVQHHVQHRAAAANIRTANRRL